jgi:kynurenine formamidase
MCVPGCLEAMARGSRRAARAPPDRGAGPGPARGAFTRVLDLTHTLGPDFPTFDPEPGLVTETVATLARDGYNMRRWCLLEHIGTYLDAPVHYADDGAPDRLEIEDLVVPLLVVDTLSLDCSRDFPTHRTWLPTGRWGLEAVANLTLLPPVGATIVVGAPKIAGATGGPARVLALV